MNFIDFHQCPKGIGDRNYVSPYGFQQGNIQTHCNLCKTYTRYYIVTTNHGIRINNRNMYKKTIFQIEEKNNNN